MTTCPHCGQPMPPQHARREPVQESLPEPIDGAQLAAFERRKLWPRADVVWRQEADDDAPR